MRIVAGGIMHESNTFASTKADRQRFLDGSLAAGADVIPIWREAHHEYGGFIEGAGRFHYELAPSVMAWATPSGPVDDAVLDEVTDRLIADSLASPPDGVLLALHEHGPRQAVMGGAVIWVDGDGAFESRLRFGHASRGEQLESELNELGRALHGSSDWN